MPPASAGIAAARARIIDNPRYPRWLLLTTLTGMFSTSFPVTILSISVKPIALDLHSTPATVTWVTTAPLLATAVATPVLGRLGDIRGHRRLYLIGIMTSLIFSVLTALAWNAISLIVFRTASQLGAAATVPSTFAMLFRSFAPHERVRASALASGTLASAAVIGVIIGGPLIDLIGWRPIFVIQASLALAALLPALIVLKKDEPVEGKQPVDYAGAAALALSTFALVLGINRIGAWGANPIAIGLLVFVPFGIWLLVVVERRAAAPLLPLRLISARNTWVVMSATFILNIGWMGTFILTPLLLQSVMGLSAAVTSLIIVPRAGSVMVISPLAGRLGVRFGERRIVVAAAFALSLWFCLVAYAAAITSVALVAVCMVLGGLLFGILQPGLVAAIGHAVSDDDFGLAVSLQQTANQIGGVIGIGLFASIAADSATPGPYEVVFLVSAGLTVVGGLIATRLHQAPRRSAARTVVVPDTAAEV
jgi:MFS family permease